MAISRANSRASKAPAQVSTPAQGQSHRASQFVLTSKVVNAPQTAFLATQANTQQQLRIAKQNQTQDPRVTTRRNRNAPKQVILPRSMDAVAFRGYATTFGSQNRSQLPSAAAKPLPNSAYLASHGRAKPVQAKSQAAAAKLHNLLA